MKEISIAIEKLLLQVSPRVYLKGKTVKEKQLINFVYKVKNRIKAYVKSENEYFKDMYKIVLKYDEGSDTFEDFSCSCPYYLEHNKVCKHIVAVSLYIKEILEDKNREIFLDNLLKSLSNEEKDRLLVDLITFNPLVYEDLLKDFTIEKSLHSKDSYKSEPSDIERKYRNIFRQVFSNLIDSISRYRGWYIDEGLEDFEALYRMETTYNSISPNKEKFIFLKVFFKEYLDLIYLDEDIFHNINENFLESVDKFFFNKFKELSTEKEIRKKIIEFICKELDFNLYSEFYEIQLFKAILDVSQDVDDYKNLYNCLRYYNIEDLEILSSIYKVLNIDRYLELVKDNKYTSSYIQKDYFNYLINIGAPQEEIRRFLYDIKESVNEEEDLKYFLNLGKEILDKDLKRIFYRKLITDFHRLEYLKDLKKILNGAEWKKEFEILKQKLSKVPLYLIGLYLFENKIDLAFSILKNMKVWTLNEALIKYMDYFKIEKYRKYFLERLYEYIDYAVNERKNRDNYKGVMEYLEEFLKYSEYKEHIIDMLNKLKEKYPKRYALHEEIDNLIEKINKKK